MPQDTVLISHKDLRELCIRPLQGLGVPGPHAEIVADSLVDANLRGVDSHGVIRLPKYVKGSRGGSINPRPQIKMTRPAKVVLQVDGDNGLGAVVACRAMNEVIRVCGNTAVAAARVRRSNHFGTVM